MDNIWHTLAENALNGKYSVTKDAIPHFNGHSSCFYHYLEHKQLEIFWYLTPEEQCLFLLFCGESYEQ